MSANNSVLLNLLMKGEDRNYGYKVNNMLPDPNKTYQVGAYGVQSSVVM